ncbi:MAG: YdcF family protein [Microcystaceae cyanobacterium]
MFLFLSKLLPLFLYPLGLASLLMLVTLILWWKHSRWTPYPIAISLIVLLLASNVWVSHGLIYSLERQIPSLTNVPNADAIVILGGATRSPVIPRQMVEVNEHGDRLLYATKLYKEGKAPLIIAAGGRIGWSGQKGSEAQDMAELLQLMGVPKTAIIEEPESLNTYQNAININSILQQENIKQIILITSAFHLPRSLLIFKKLGINPIPAPTDFFVTLNNAPSSLEGIILGILPDAHRLSVTTLALKEYIGIIIYRLRGWL